MHGQLLARPAQTREKVIGEARQHGTDRVWIEKLEIETCFPESTATADRPEIVARLLAEIDTVVADASNFEPSSYIEKLKGRVERIDLPDDHPLLSSPFPSSQEIAAARDLLLARLLGDR